MKKKKMKEEEKPKCFGREFGSCLKKNACPYKLDCQIEFLLKRGDWAKQKS